MNETVMAQEKNHTLINKMEDYRQSSSCTALSWPDSVCSGRIQCSILSRFYHLRALSSLFLKFFYLFSNSTMHKSECFQPLITKLATWDTKGKKRASEKHYFVKPFFLSQFSGGNMMDFCHQYIINPLCPNLENMPAASEGRPELQHKREEKIHKLIVLRLKPQHVLDVSFYFLFARAINGHFLQKAFNDSCQCSKGCMMLQYDTTNV